MIPALIILVHYLHRGLDSDLTLAGTHYNVLLDRRTQEQCFP